jgi:hypothetical protein
MNTNNVRKSGLAIAMAVAMGASAGANAAVELYSEDGTSFSVDGYFNAFYVNRDDKLNDVRNSDVKMGFQRVFSSRPTPLLVRNPRSLRHVSKQRLPTQPI